MDLFVAGISHKTAAVALRELFAVAPSNQAETARRVRCEAGLSEVVLLWTCNRVELYGVAEPGSVDPRQLLLGLASRPADVGDAAYTLYGADAAAHLFRVTSGLESMVLGETDIVNQVKAAYDVAHGAGLTGRVLNRLFQKAMEVTKDIRTNTAIGKGATSVGSVAVLHALSVFGGSLRDRRVLVIGAGKMAETCLRYLVKKGVASITVTNRSLENAEQLARTVEGTAVPFLRCLDAMAESDIVISSTGCPHTILHAPDVATVMARRPAQPLIIIDIAVPRDVAPEVKGMDNVHLFDIDDLQATVQENVRYRAQDLHLCDAIIDRHVASLMPRLAERREELHAACTA